MVNVSWILESATADGRLLRWELADGSHRIGRAPHNEITLADPTVSNNHAEIEIHGESAVIADSGSRNGTWRNNLRIASPTPLVTGDRLRIGTFDFSVRRSDMASEPHLQEARLSAPEQIHTTSSFRRERLLEDLQTPGRPDRRLLRALTDAGKLLVSVQPIEEVYQTVLDLAAGVIPARRILLLLSEKGDPTLVVRAARPRESAGAERIMLSRTLVEAVIQRGESLLVSDAMSDPQFHGHESIIMQNVQSAMVAPLFDNDKILGMIYVDTSDPTVRYDDDQLRVFTMLANLIAVKITNTYLMESQRAKERMEQEMATATMIQQKLLPAEMPKVAGYEMAARQVPCFEVGGDLYDAGTLRDGSILFAVGDVSGKGLGAALLMSHLIASMRVLYDEELPLPDLAAKVHREIMRSSDARSYATLFIGRIDPREHRLDYVNAGHNPPYVIVAGESAPSTLDPTSMPIGLFEEAEFEMASREIPPGALIAVFSDGVTEAVHSSDFFSEERLIASLRSRIDRPLEEIAAGVMDDVRAFVSDAPASDDITLLLVRRIG
jgi:phosphoserine phosphatase RsbU/P